MLDLSMIGRPRDSGYIEPFKGRSREESLKAIWFLSLDDAKDKIGAWREDLHASRHQMSRGCITPLEFASHSGDIP